MLTLLPLFLVQGLAGGGAMASNWLLTLMGAAAGLFFFVKILWPHLRRFLLLQFLIYFRLTDGETGPWAGRIWRLYEVLRSYPSHMNQGVAVFLMTFLGAGLISAIIVTMLTMAGIPPLLSKFFGNAILFLGLLWPFTALAGFHRLILSPMESSSEAAYADRSVTD
jgi:hypothetical protein